MNKQNLKLALAQCNYTVGDFEGNLNLMLAKIKHAAEVGADMVVFSELSVCGYYPGDLLEDADFLNACQAALQAILKASKQFPTVFSVIGTVRPHKGPGKHLHNALLVIQDGEILAEYHKQLLPTYGIFDEGRHFEPGVEGACTLRIGPHRVGFMVCEDGWNDAGLDYKVNPYAALEQAQVDLVVSINASPSDFGKRQQRHRLFGQASTAHQMPIVYVNQIGGQDQLVFDGHSFIMHPQRGVVYEAAGFAEDFAVLNFDGDNFIEAQDIGSKIGDQIGIAPRAAVTQKEELARQQIVLGLRDYARRCGFSKAVVGSSGGIDSALTLALAVEALGADNVIAITMPSAFSSEGSVSDSVKLCQALGIPLLEHPIRDLVDQYGKGFTQAFDAPLRGLTLENLQARVRGTILMEYSNHFGALLLTTGNKSEISVGYCTLYGDTNGGLGLIGDLYKTEVYALSRHVNQSAGREIIPQDVLTKPPSAELAPGQLDTDSLPPYEVLDEILKWHIEGHRLPPEEAQQAHASVENLKSTVDGVALLKRIHGMVARNEYKRRQAPPIIRVRARAFGTGRQMPIAARYTF